jgi:hypothetical protein
MDMKTHFLPAHANSLILANELFPPRGLLCSQPFLFVSVSVNDIIFNIQHEVSVEKLPFWCFGGAFALMGRCRELAQQLLNEPFDQVKAQIVRSRRVADGNFL